MKVFKKEASVIALAIATIVPISVEAQSQYDQLMPFGYATCATREDANASLDNITGGGAYTYDDAMKLAESGDKSVKVLTAQDVKDLEAAGKKDVIKNAIRDNDIVVLDGSDGDFVFPKFIWVQNYSNKTILGINNARLVTEWTVTDEIIEALQAAGVESASTTSGGGTLSNGVKITEQAEYLTRKTMLELTGDDTENYRNAGIFSVKKCSNMIFRNLTFVGPGSIDCSGKDLLSIEYTTNCWVDHCTFIDGIDGNCDITNESDFITVSWSNFSYTERSVMHQNTSLVGSSDSKTSDDDKLDVTFAYNEWGSKCRARMPMARYGRFHMLNNYFNCPGNKTACINPRIKSEFLIEGNYFEDGVKKVFSASSDATSYVWASDNVIMQSGVSAPTTKGECVITYNYDVVDAKTIKDEIISYSGATLWNAVSTDIAAVDSSATTSGSAVYNLAGQCVNDNFKGIVVKNGKKMLVK